MIYKLIESYMQKISPSDVEKFSIEHNIILTKEEIDIFYKAIKNNWYQIIYQDPTPIFMEIKPKLSTETYKKAEELFFYFKNKYQNLL